jgi:glutamyl-tRNA synthetase
MAITTVIRAERYRQIHCDKIFMMDAAEICFSPLHRPLFVNLGEDKQEALETTREPFVQPVQGWILAGCHDQLHPALLGWNDGTDNEIFSREELIDALT